MRAGDLAYYKSQVVKVVELPFGSPKAVVEFTTPRTKGEKPRTITVPRAKLRPKGGGTGSTGSNGLRGVGTIMAGGRRRVGDSQAVLSQSSQLQEEEVVMRKRKPKGINPHNGRPNHGGTGNYRGTSRGDWGNVLRQSDAAKIVECPECGYTDGRHSAFCSSP